MKRTDDQIRCQFFKELSAAERLKVLRVFLDIPDAAAAEVNSHSIEAKLLSRILRPTAAASAQPVGEPFAWAYRAIGTGEWRATMNKQWAHAIDGMETKPLYDCATQAGDT